MKYWVAGGALSLGVVLFLFVRQSDTDQPLDTGQPLRDEKSAQETLDGMNTAISVQDTQDAFTTDNRQVILGDAPILAIPELKPVSGPSRDELMKARSLALSRAFNDNAYRLASTLDSLMGSRDTDESWSDEAASVVDDWFYSDKNSGPVSTECVDVLCYLDVFSTSTEFRLEISPKFANWSGDSPGGFLPYTFFIRAGDEHFRIYLFRDTFDPAVL